MRTKAELWAALRSVYSVDELQTMGLGPSAPHRELLQLFMNSGRGVTDPDHRAEGREGTLWAQWSEAARVVWMLRELGMGPREDLAQHAASVWPDATTDHAKRRAALFWQQQDMVRRAVIAAVGSFNLAQLGLD